MQVCTVAALVIVAGAAFAVSGGTATAEAQGQATVEVRVWQSIEDAERLYISARPASGSWATLGTIRLPLDDGRSSDGRFMYGDIGLDVRLADRPPLRVEVRVWQHSLRLERVYVSARPALGSWATLGTIRLLLDDGETSSYRYGDIRLGVSLPPPLPSVTVEFWGDFSEERQEEIRDETLSVVAYFADRYRLLEPGFELHVGADAESLTQARRDVLGIPNPSPLVCGEAVNERVFIFDWCATATHDLTSPLAHEYFHVLQAHLAAGASGPIAVADWLLEGTAEYMAIEYGISKGHFSRTDVEDALLAAVTSEPFNLRDAEANISQFDLTGYEVAAFATGRLVGQTSERQILDFFQTLPRTRDWRAAFSQAFGMETNVFYADFASLVEAHRPRFVDVVMRVLGPDGNHLPSTHATAYGSGVRQGQGTTVADGVSGLRFTLPQGAYYFRIWASNCLTFGGSSYGSSILQYLAEYPSRPWPEGRNNRVELGEDVDIVVQLPDWPSELNINCGQREKRHIRGTVVSDGDHDFSAYRMAAHPAKPGVSGTIYLDEAGRAFRPDESGAFEIAVPDGWDYHLKVRNECGVEVGWHVSGGNVVPSAGETFVDDDGTSAGRLVTPSEATVVSVDGADVTGVRIRLPEVIAADEWNDQLREDGVCADGSFNSG